MSARAVLPSRHRGGRRSGAARERGLILVLVLVVLAMMALAGMSVMRTVDTANVLAGNFAFQQAATQASDRALTDALSTVANRVSGSAGNTGVANQYLNVTAATVDARGVPASVNWDNVSCVDEKGALLADCAAATGAYRVQYVIERMCSSNPDLGDINDIRAKCAYEASTSAGSAATIGLHYRVLIRVRGPRGTENWFEAMVSGPAST